MFQDSKNWLKLAIVKTGCLWFHTCSNEKPQNDLGAWSGLIVRVQNKKIQTYCSRDKKWEIHWIQHYRTWQSQCPVCYCAATMQCNCVPSSESRSRHCQTYHLNVMFAMMEFCTLWFFDTCTLATVWHLLYSMKVPRIFNLALEHIWEDTCKIFKKM